MLTLRGIFQTRRKSNLDLLYVSAIAKDFVKTSIRPQNFESANKSKFSKLIWVVPVASPFGGGFKTISRFVNYFEKMNIPQELHIYHPVDGFELNHQKNIWRRNIGLNPKVEIKKSLLSSKDNALVIATGWQTIYYVIANTKRNQRAWFIQDDEVQFHPSGDISEMILMAYKYFPKALTAGPWLANLAKSRGIVEVSNFEFGVDQVYFMPKNLRHRRRRQIIIYWQPAKSWRASTFLLSVAFLLSKNLPDWRIVLVGEDSNLDLKLPSNVKNIGAVSPIELAQLYSESQIGVVASKTNASLIPLEMVSSGLSVVTNSGANSVWISEPCEHLKYVDFELNFLVQEIIKISHSDSQNSCFLDHNYSWEIAIASISKDFLRDFFDFKT